MGLLEQNKAQSREKRLNTLSSYLGNIDIILNEIEKNDVKQRIRTFTQTTFDEIIYSLNAISTIEDSVIVVHGPLGCSAAELHFFSEGNENVWYTSNLNERDTIMGGDEKLRKTILLAYKKRRPKVIFIIATPVVAINNDDIRAVTLELEDELGVKIISIHTDGFKSKTSINGYDLALHSIAKGLVKKADTSTKINTVNLISVSENNKDIKEIVRLLRKIGIEVNLIPKFSEVNSIIAAANAKISVALNDDEGNYLAQILEESFNVPFIKTYTPIGIKNTSNWLKNVADAVGFSETAQNVIEKETDNIEKIINISPLDGTKVYIDLPTSNAVSTIKLVEELGGEVIGITVDKVDELNKNELEQIDKNIQIRIANGQIFETANILYKLKPDLYISGLGKTAWASKQGIPSISVSNIGLFGFNGIIEFVDAALKSLKNKNFVDKISRNRSLPYINSWLNKSPNWYIKQEVK